MSITDIAVTLIKAERQKSKDARDEAMRAMKAKQHETARNYIRLAQFHDAQIEGMQRLARELNAVRRSS